MSIVFIKRGAGKHQIDSFTKKLPKSGTLKVEVGFTDDAFDNTRDHFYDVYWTFDPDNATVNLTEEQKAEVERDAIECIDESYNNARD
jgi:hypothetical protein